MGNFNIHYINNLNEYLLKDFKSNEMFLGPIGGNALFIWLFIILFLFITITFILDEKIKLINYFNYIKDKKRKYKELNIYRKTNFKNHEDFILLYNENKEESLIEELNSLKLSLKEYFIFIILSPFIVFNNIIEELGEDFVIFMTVIVLSLLGLSLILVSIINVTLKDNYFISKVESEFLTEEIITYPVLSVENTDYNNFIINYLNENNKVVSIQYNGDINYKSNLKIDKKDLNNSAIGYVSIINYNKILENYKKFIKSNKNEIKKLDDNYVLEILNNIFSDIENGSKDSIIDSVTIKN